MKSRAAPEELQGTAAREGPDFGPSRWFALSLGRREGAEPRWVLPMLCRSLNLGRSDVGAIRVQEEETFVEVAEAACEGLIKRLKRGPELEGGAMLKPLARPPFPPRTEGKPPAPARAEGPGPAAAPKAHRKGPAQPKARPDDAAALQALLDAPDPVAEAPRKPFKARPKDAPAGERPFKPRPKDAPAADKPKWKKPRRSGMKTKATGAKHKPR